VPIVFLAIIRYGTRFFGFRIAAKLISLLINDSLLFFLKDKQQIKYFLKINYLNITYRYHLINGNFVKSNTEKLKWAKLIFERSKTDTRKKAAMKFIKIMSYPSNQEFAYDQVKKSNKNIKRKIYLYGPNSLNRPSKKYKDYTIIFTKPINFDSTDFSGSILFLSSNYFIKHNIDDPNIKKQLEKYDLIYMSCQKTKLLGNMKRSFNKEDTTLSSLMGLGRILRKFSEDSQIYDCVIEGFDFYLKSNLYQEYYPTNPSQSNLEKAVAHSIAHHDALYNFVYVKNIIKRFNIIDSINFKKIISLHPLVYMDKLSKSVNLKLLNP
tara:strand:- start:54 stop:1022 length:969 start_codon:yes stop_codon:yes gene_type:complete